ncbi:MAG: DNA translocase FtsK, partial [Bdellovibrionota bacterium]
MENRQRSLAVEVGSIFVFALGVFALFSLATYHPGDPSVFSNAHGVAQNACGRVGGYLASFTLQCFGLGAFLIPAALFFMAAGVHRREGSLKVFATLGGMAVAVISLTVFLALQWKYWPYAGSLLLTGGALGTWVSEILIHQFNPLGSSIVSLVVFCVAIALSTPVSVSELGARIFGFFARFSWKMTKLTTTYIVYLLGLLAMRSAHAAGDLMQRLIEGAVTRARDRAKASAKAVADTRMKDVVAEHVPSVIENHAPILPSEAPNVLQTKALEAAGAKGLPVDALKMPEIITTKEMRQTELPLERPAKPRSSKRGQWKLPIVDFLKKPEKTENSVDRDKVNANAKLLVQKFADFDISGEVEAARPGPVVTLYEFKPGQGIKLSKIANLADDISMAVSAQSVRIIAPLPGKAVVGIEIPSENRQTVFLREFLQDAGFHDPKKAIPVVMGKDIGGAPFFSDLSKMPHLLCAGTTGSGKSVFINGLICSLLYRFTPDELRLILVDPKTVEFAAYHDIPHLLLPVVDEPKQAGNALKWAVREMDRRYRIFSKIGVKHLAGYNEKVTDMGEGVLRDLLMEEEETPVPASGSDWLQAFEPDETGQAKIGKLPYIVIIIDELADLMMVAKKEVEISIARIAQKARACGIHLVIATQRPSVDVVTGLIKSNLPCRVSCKLSSVMDSRTILDRGGADRLLGAGDMLFIPPGTSDPIRLHGAY